MKRVLAALGFVSCVAVASGNVEISEDLLAPYTKIIGPALDGPYTSYRQELAENFKSYLDTCATFQVKPELLELPLPRGDSFAALARDALKTLSILKPWMNKITQSPVEEVAAAGSSVVRSAIMCASYSIYSISCVADYSEILRMKILNGAEEVLNSLNKQDLSTMDSGS